MRVETIGKLRLNYRLFTIDRSAEILDLSLGADLPCLVGAAFPIENRP
jgi:hypothetical protein